MQCAMRDLRRKEVINIHDGCRIGCVGDLEIRIPEGQISAIIVFGPPRFFGLFGRGEEFYIPWDCIQRIGDDIILVDKPFHHHHEPDGGPKPPRRPWFYGQSNPGPNP